LITCQQWVERLAVPHITRLTLNPCRAVRAARPGARNNVIHRFSPTVQRTLYSGKFFAIMALIGGIPHRSTTAGPRFEDRYGRFLFSLFQRKEPGAIGPVILDERGGHPANWEPLLFLSRPSQGRGPAGTGRDATGANRRSPDSIEESRSRGEPGRCDVSLGHGFRRGARTVVSRGMAS
jgi:hypothetical protein